MAQSLVLATSNAMYWPLWRDLDAYIAISPHIAEYLVSEGFPAQRIHVISNPIETVDAPVDTGVGVLYAGRLEREKGIELLLDAWNLLPAGLRLRHPLHIAGKGSLDKLVRERARSDPSIRLHGLLDSSTLADLARDCSVTVIPSIWDEPFGRVAAEALMRGHALVVTNRGALRDLAAAGAAWIVEPQPHALQEAITQAVSADKQLRQDGQTLAEDQFSLASVGKSYSHVFWSLVRQAGR